MEKQPKELWICLWTLEKKKEKQTQSYRQWHHQAWWCTQDIIISKTMLQNVGPIHFLHLVYYYIVFSTWWVID